jgi:hypothetical protein
MPKNKLPINASEKDEVGIVIRNKTVTVTIYANKILSISFSIILFIILLYQKRIKIA